MKQAADSLRKSAANFYSLYKYSFGESNKCVKDKKMRKEK